MTVPLCVVLLFSVLGPSAAAASPRVGFNDNTPFIQPSFISDADLASTLGSTGAGIHRIEFDWAFAQPNPPGPAGDGYNAAYFNEFDAVYNADLAAGVSMVIVPMDAPNWARTIKAQALCAPLLQPSPSNCVAPPAPSRYGDYYALLRKLALRYPQALATEIWNEPNLSLFWRPTADMHAYADLLKGSYQAVKSAQPSMTVLTGGLANAETSKHGNVPLAASLSTLYGDAGARSFDGISFHAYPCPRQSPDILPLIHATSVLRTVRDNNGDSAKPLWLTETGATTNANAPANCDSHYSEHAQGAVIAGALDWAHCQPDFAAALVHTLYEPSARTNSITWTPSLTNGAQGFGLIAWAHNPLTNTFVTKPKPGYAAVSAAMAAPPACG